MLTSGRTVSRATCSKSALLAPVRLRSAATITDVSSTARNTSYTIPHLIGCLDGPRHLRSMWCADVTRTAGQASHPPESGDFPRDWEVLRPRAMQQGIENAVRRISIALRSGLGHAGTVMHFL